jgi:MinD-like ATPase involved in chromosome partitioning or flagellar assembly
LEDVEKHFGIPVVAVVKDDINLIESLFYFKPHVVYRDKSKTSKEIKRFAGSLAGNPEKISWFMKNFGKFGKEKVNRELMRKKLYNL